jgi:hypothetical protein
MTVVHPWCVAGLLALPLMNIILPVSGVKTLKPKPLTALVFIANAMTGMVDA